MRSSLNGTLLSRKRVGSLLMWEDTNSFAKLSAQPLKAQRAYCFVWLI